MKERLAILLKNEGLTSSKLAEILEVQPATISHILAGRNNPGFDFLVKVMQCFPAINPDWLILGEGSIYRNSMEATHITAHQDKAQPSLFSEEMPSNTSLRAPMEQDEKRHPEVEQPLTAQTEPTQNLEKISKIIVCYDDRTFWEYNSRDK